MSQRGETEDGLGWGGLVASKAELREERRQAQLEKDAARYRWLAQRLIAADFDYNGEGVQALVFSLPLGCSVSADCNATIDGAMRVAPAV